MQNRSIRYGAFLLAVIFALSVCFIDADAQRRRKRRARRVTSRVVRPVVTNPAIAPPGAEQASTSDGERIISTADENPTEPEQTPESAQPKKRRAAAKTGDAQDMQETINALSNQVNRLNDKLSQMQENDRSLIDMERLTRAEQRSEALRAQLLDTESKLADLQSKLDQIEYALKPENIERAASYGTVHPEEARESRRRQLENERTRVLAQIRILETSRTRLETSIGTADAEVDALRRRLEQQRQEGAGSSRSESSPSTNRKP